MPFKRPSLKEIEQRVLIDLSVVKPDKEKRVSFKKLLGRAIAGCSHMLHGHISSNDGIILPDTEDETYILKWAKIMGIVRKNGDFARGALVLKSDPGIKIPKGTEFRNPSTDLLYISIEDVVTNETTEVKVICQTIGTIGNVEAGTAMQLTVTIPSVTSILTKEIIGGLDIETHEDLQRRYLFKLANPSSGGDDADYINIALGGKHVTRAYVFPNIFGIGTVGVSFLFDNLNTKTKPIPDISSEQFKNVKKHIIINCPAIARQGLAVFPPKNHKLKIKAKIIADKDKVAIKEKIEAGLKELIRFDSHIAGSKIVGTEKDKYSGVIYLSQILNIFAQSGAKDYELYHPKKNVTPSKMAIVTYDGVNWVED